MPHKESKGTPAVGPNSTGFKGKNPGGGVVSDGKMKGSNKGNFNVIKMMNKTINHTTSFTGKTKAQ